LAFGSAQALDHGNSNSEARAASAPRPADLSHAVAAAEGGDAKAQWQLGMAYMKGTGVERDMAAALRATLIKVNDACCSSVMFG
jgi:TPR repeat protein